MRTTAAGPAGPDGPAPSPDPAPASRGTGGTARSSRTSSTLRERLAAALLADLGDWSVHLGLRSFTQVSVEMLLRDLRRAVPSALGYRLVVVEADDLPEVSITVVDDGLAPGPAGASISFDLPVARGGTAVVTFFAGEEGAFEQLADLLGRAAGLEAGDLRPGALAPGDLQPGVHGLTDPTTVNQAIGVLLARGLSFQESERHLQRLAAQLGTLDLAAEHLLAGLLG